MNQTRVRDLCEGVVQKILLQEQFPVHTYRETIKSRLKKNHRQFERDYLPLLVLIWGRFTKSLGTPAGTAEAISEQIAQIGRQTPIQLWG